MEDSAQLSRLAQGSLAVPVERQIGLCAKPAIFAGFAQPVCKVWSGCAALSMDGICRIGLLCLHGFDVGHHQGGVSGNRQSM